MPAQLTKFPSEKLTQKELAPVTIGPIQVPAYVKDHLIKEAVTEDRSLVAQLRTILKDHVDDARKPE